MREHTGLEGDLVTGWGETLLRPTGLELTATLRAGWGSATSLEQGLGFRV